LGAQPGGLIATFSTAGAENTGQTQLNAADAKRIWRGMVEIESEKNEKDQAFM
jgi:hypothetical protein